MVANLIKFFVDYKRTTILCLVIILIYGYTAFVNIPKESDPSITIPFAGVTITMDGISPEDAERMLLKVTENTLDTIAGIKNMTSYAYEGGAQVNIEFYPDINKDTAIQNVRDKVNSISTYPTDARKPIVTEMNIDEAPVITIGLNGDLPTKTLIEIARKLRDQIQSIPEVLQASIIGDLEDVIQVIVDPSVIEADGLSLQAVSQIVQYNNSIIKAGLMREKNGEYNIKVPALVDNYTELMKFPVQADGNSVLKIGDVAEVRRTYKDPTDTATINGKKAIVLEVSKRSGTNIIEVIDNVKAIVKDASREWPSELQVTFSQDKSGQIKDMLLDLENSIILAAILVVIVIIVGVGVKSSLIISLSLPFSFCAGILILYLTGNTMNIVVLFSLILSVGMVVDDAIVVSEYADRKMIEGATPQASYIESAIRMFNPILTSTVVKIIVFMPLLFWPGIIGQFMKYMPITVITILLSSLAFALLFQPSIGPIIIKKHDEVDENAIKSMLAAENGDLKDLSGFSKHYYNLLERVLNNSGRFVSIVLGLIFFIYVIFFIFGAGVEFFPKVEPDNATVILRAPGNLSLFQKQEIVKQVEDRILDMSNEIDVFYSKAGAFDNNENNLPQDTIATINLEFKDWNKRRKVDVILDDIKKRTNDIEGVVVQFLTQMQGPNESKPIRMEVGSKTYDDILPFVIKLRAAMEKIGGFKDTDDSRPVPAIEWHFYVDREIAARYSIAASDVGNLLNMATGGYKISTMRLDDVDDEIDIVLLFPEKFRRISMLDGLKLVNMNAYAVPINLFTTKKAVQKVSQRKHVDRMNVITVTTDVQEGVLPDNKILEIQKWFKQQKENYPTIDIMFKGDKENQDETSNFLRVAFGTAILLMSIVMLLQFNRFYQMLIVMSAVFISTAGVLLGLLITWQPFGIVMCGVGTIALSGIVLNNNILLIDTYNHLRKEGHNVHNAIIRAGIQRVRPILLTATTAILGLLPMILGITVDFFDRNITHGAPSTQWWTQLSASIAGGLAFATMLTLFFTPALLMLCKRFEENTMKAEVAK